MPSAASGSNMNRRRIRRRIRRIRSIYLGLIYSFN
jgi:hypothetical protein